MGDTKNRKVSFDYALLGEVLEPRAGVIAVDVGGKCMPGIIDHHFVGSGPDCAARRVARRGQELVLDFLAEAPGDGELTILMHRAPDIDCLVSSFLTLELVRHGELRPGCLALAEYAQAIDEGLPPPDGLNNPSSLWALYTATTKQLHRPDLEELNNRPYEKWLEKGFELLELILLEHPEKLAEVRLSPSITGWEKEQELLSRARDQYEDDLRRSTSFDIDLPKLRDGSQKVKALRIENPRSPLFKFFARAEGFCLTHLISPRIPTSDLENGESTSSLRHVISLTPEKGLWLRGLGQALERQEVMVRANRGIPRLGPPRWGDVTNSDPWYDGRSSLQGYTIIDTPHHGTVLTSDEIIDIVQNSDEWMVLGRAPSTRRCPQGCEFPKDIGHYCPTHGLKLIPAVVDGRYRVLEKLGTGGMSIVYKVLDRQTGQLYALKHLLPSFIEDLEMWKIFTREARIANRVGHPNVVRLVDTGADTTAGLYMVTELIEGVTLSKDMRAFTESGIAYPWPRMKAVLLQVCRALTAVHEAGVLHRDLKPGNIMLRDEKAGSKKEPDVKVLDFGVAILSDPAATRLTIKGAFHGTPEYAAPEQFFDTDQDERTDLYALGCILYELLCGETPFSDRSNVMSMALARCSEPAPQLTKRTTVLKEHPGLEPLVESLLGSARPFRPSSAAEVYETLSKL